MPGFELSTLSRRSEYTTSRSLLMIAGSNARFSMRSASRSKTVSSAGAGNQSWYTVTSFDVYALLDPPASASTLSNSPLPYFLAPLNIMCSKKCEIPVIPSCSLREPTWNHV